MSLKIAQLNYVDENGYEKSLLLSITNVNTNYKTQRVTISYEGWKDAEAQAKGIAPVFFQHEIEMDLSNRTQLSLVNRTSDVLWAANVDVPLIPDFSDTDADGKVQPKLSQLFADCRW